MPSNYNLPPQLRYIDELVNGNKNPQNPMLSLYQPPDDTVNQVPASPPSDNGSPLSPINLAPETQASKQSNNLSDILAMLNKPPTQEELDLRKRAEESRNAQLGGVNSIQSQIAKIQSAPTQTNWAPFIAGVDSITGSNILPGYKAPKSQADKDAEVVKLNELLQNSRNQLTERDVSEIKALKDANSNKALTAFALADYKNKNQNKRFDDKDIQTTTHAYNTDVKKANEGVETAKASLDTLEQAKDNPTAYAALPLEALKGIIKQRIAASEIQMVMGGKDWESKLNRMAETASKGTIDEKDYNGFKQLLSSALNRAQDYKGEILNRHAGQLTKRQAAQGMDIDTAKAYLEPNGVSQAAPATANPSGSGFDMDAAKAELQKRINAKKLNLGG